MILFNSKKSNLGLRKVIVFAIMFFVLFFGFQSILNLGETTQTNLGKISLTQQIQKCEIGNCDIVKCEDGDICSEGERLKWNQMLNYAKKCDLNPDNCDSLQKYVNNLKNGQLNSGNSNNNRNFGTTNLESCSKKLKESLGVNCEKILQINKLGCINRGLKDLSPEFMSKIENIANEIGASKIDLLKSMDFESGHTFCSCALNSGSGAVGLIQFMPTTAKSLGTNSLKLCQMKEVDQLDYVLKYFNNLRNGKSLDSLENLYMTILWPRAVGKPTDYILYKKTEAVCTKSSKTAYCQNKGQDLNKNNEITVAEATKLVYDSTTLIG